MLLTTWHPIGRTRAPPCAHLWRTLGQYQASRRTQAGAEGQGRTRDCRCDPPGLCCVRCGYSHSRKLCVYRSWRSALERAAEQVFGRGSVPRILIVLSDRRARECCGDGGCGPRQHPAKGKSPFPLLRSSSYAPRRRCFEPRPRQKDHKRPTARTYEHALNYAEQISRIFEKVLHSIPPHDFSIQLCPPSPVTTITDNAQCSPGAFYSAPGTFLPHAACFCHS